MKIRDALAFFDELQLPEWQQPIARPLVDDVRSRLAYLVDVGVGYLALDRSLRTLSGGEAQRVALTATLGSSLVDMLYVLDEPSVGLHPADVAPLAAAIERLQRARQHGGRRRARRGDHSPGRPRRRVRPRRRRRRRAGRVSRHAAENWRRATTAAPAIGWPGGGGSAASGPRRTTAHGWIKLRGARGNNLQESSRSSFRSACCAW